MLVLQDKSLIGQLQCLLIQLKSQVEMQSEFVESIANEKQLYEDLSTLILTFKRLASLAQTVAIFIQKGQDYSASLLKIKSLVQTLDSLKLRYQSVSAQSKMQPMTFHRFICRLLEVITFLKGKSHNRGSQHHFFILNRCFEQIQASIRICKETNDLYRVIKVIQMSFVKFCINSRAPQGDQCRKVQDKREESLKQMRQRMIKDQANEHNVEKCIRFNHMATQMDESQSEESDSRSQRAFKKENMTRKNYHITTEYNKQLSKLQKRFDTLKDLGLDYSSFKSDYFMAKGNQPLFFRQYLQKNVPIRRIITNYYDDFLLFQKKRSQKEIRKDRYKLKPSMKRLQISNMQQSLLEGQSSKWTGICDQSQIIVSKSIVKVQNKQQNCFEEHGCRSLDYDGNKRQLKLKNVQITLLNGIKEGKKYKVLTHFNKNKTRLQPICVNQYYYNDLQTQTKNSLQFLHRKLKLQVGLRKCNKTEHQISLKNDNRLKQIQGLSQINKQSQVLKLALKSKSTFQAKYLEVNCRSQKKSNEIRRLATKEGFNLQKITLKNIGHFVKRQSQGKLFINNQQ